MGNKLPNTSRITTNLVEENEPIPKMLPTWEKVLDSEKEELEASKCLFEAKGHDSCCKTIMDFKISRIISQTERINVFEVEDTATEVRFAVKIYEREKRKAYQKNEIRLLTILHDIEGDFVKCEHRFTTKNHNVIVLELFVSDLYDYMKHRNKMLSLEMARFLAMKLVRIIRILHENNIIYADIKRGNIAIDKKGNLKLIDFDQSCRAGEKLDFVPLGSINYMAPEQANKHITMRSDWYGVGSIIWKTLSNITPNEKYTKAISKDPKVDKFKIVRKISKMKKDIKLKTINDDQKAALHFVKECIRVKVEDRIDLDEAGADFDKVEFLKAVTSEAEERFNKEMLQYVQHVMKTRKGFLLLY